MLESKMAAMHTSELNTSLQWRYVLVSENLYQPELGEYHTYGIKVFSHDYTHLLRDVSVCKKTAEHILMLLNHHQVSPIHLLDVVADMLP